MSPEQVQLNKIFSDALACASPGERERYLAAACGHDPELRRQVDSLLEAQALSGDFLEQTVIARGGPHLGEKPGDLIGRYKLLEKIGEGGMGVVYMAEQEEPVRRRVALKIIKLGMDTNQVVARFEAERQALALMDHPNIAKVLDAGATDTGRPYFVMELVHGVPITEFCDKNRLSAEERVKLFIPVCQAIQSAHQKGIIHRDIKPTNILVTLNAGVPMPLVIDFGVAKATNQKLTEKMVFTSYAAMIGTPAYMSPEQAEMSRLDVDTRSDIYGLGVLLYELLTGTTPFPEKRLRSAGYHEMQRIILEEEPERPSTRLSTLAGEQRGLVARNRGASELALGRLSAGDLDCIVMKCLEKDRARRYETANGLAADLKRHLNDEPVVARPPSKAYRLQKVIRRNQLAFVAGAVVAAALVVGTGISAWQAVVATRAKGKALAAQKEAQRARETEKLTRVEAEHELYAVKMNLAQQAWDENNVGRLRQLLEQTQDSPYRGFEWYYWQPKAHLALKTLRGHLDAVTSVAFSADGRRILTGSHDKTAKVWDAASGKELVTLKGHRDEVECAAFSPDERRIVTGSDDRTARVWEAASGRELLVLKGHTASILSVAFSPDGQRIVTGSWDKTAKVWETASGRELLTFKGHSDNVMSVMFSRDGKRIVTGSFDHTAKVWEAASGHELRTLKAHHIIYSVAFSPDGRRIVGGGSDGTAKVWGAASGEELLTLKGHTAQILGVAFSPDGRRIVTGCYDQTARVWDAANGRELLTLKGHGNRIWGAAFSPDGQRVVTGSWDKTAKVWDVAGDMSADQKGRNVLALIGHGNGILSMGFSQDRRRIVTGSADHAARVWDAATGKELLTLKGHGDWIMSVAFSLDGQRIVTGSRDQTAKVWDAATGQELLALKGHSDTVYAVAFSPDGRRIVTCGGDGTVKAWEAASGRELLTLKEQGDDLGFVSFSPDGQRFVTPCYETARVWDAASGKRLLTLNGHSGGVYAAAFSPDGQRIVIGYDGGTATMWDAATGRELLALNGHSAPIKSMAFSPDGRRIVTGSYDHTAKVWEADSGRELLTLKGHSEAVLAVTFSPDGQRIVTGGIDLTVRAWELARPEQVAAWQEEERAAAQSLAALERESTAQAESQRIARARDSIRQWLILAPIPLATGESGAEGLDLEQLEGEGRLRPRAGEASSLGGGELKWRAVALEDEVIDFHALLGYATKHAAAYAVCYVRSEGEQRGLQMLVGSEDEAKVYLNAKQVYKAPGPHGIVAVEDTVSDLALKAGLNVLVFKVVNEFQAWKGSIRFTDAQGNPVKGITVTLEPEGKDLR